LHEHSPRAARPFIAINCGAIPSSLIESELFGHENGAFTGARGRHAGFFEQANQGTLFLDEIGDLAMATQIKLLRVLQERSLYRVGGRQEVRFDVRVIAATNRNLERLKQNGEFREDLFQRLSGFPIVSPELRDHAEDIWPLIKHFLLKCRNAHSLTSLSVHRDAISFLEAQPWPGNVRELENTIYRAALLASGRPIRLQHVQQASEAHERSFSMPVKLLRDPPTDLFDKASSGELKNLHAQVIEQTERSLFKKAIAIAHGNQSKIARWLGLSRKTVRGKLRHFHLLDSEKDSPR
jgi:DNA-binding NtrC family response regulator